MGEQIDTYVNGRYPTIRVDSESGHEERNVSFDGVIIIEPTTMGYMWFIIIFGVCINIFLYMHITYIYILM